VEQVEHGAERATSRAVAIAHKRMADDLERHAVLQSDARYDRRIPRRGVRGPGVTMVPTTLSISGEVVKFGDQPASISLHATGVLGGDPLEIGQTYFDVLGLEREGK
jgi:hypothetical protein